MDEAPSSPPNLRVSRPRPSLIALVFAVSLTWAYEGHGHRVLASLRNTALHLLVPPAPRLLPSTLPPPPWVRLSLLLLHKSQSMRTRGSPAEKAPPPAGGGSSRPTSAHSWGAAQTRESQAPLSVCDAPGFSPTLARLTAPAPLTADAAARGHCPQIPLAVPSARPPSVSRLRQPRALAESRDKGLLPKPAAGPRPTPRL